MKRTTKSLIALLVLVAMCVSFCVPTFAEVTESGHEHTTDNSASTEVAPEVVFEACPGTGKLHTEKNAHAIKEVVVAKCGVMGYTLAVCSTCGDLYTYGATAATGVHEPVETNVVAATCVTDGSYDLVCGKCGDVIETGKVLPKEDVAHTLGEAYPAGDPCSSTGSAYFRDCTVDGCEYTEEVEDSHKKYDEHNWVILEGLDENGEPYEVLAGCCQPGKTTFECSYCGRVKVVTIKPTFESHNFASADAWADGATDTLKDIQAPTHTEKGSAKVKCTNAGCNEWNTVEIHPTGHDAVLEDVPGQAPTCTEDGYSAYKKCSCGYIEGKVTEKAPGHNLSSEEVAGDCNNAKKKITSCSECDYSVVVYLDLDGKEHETTSEEYYVHTYGAEPNASEEANCIMLGYELYYCTLCGHKNVVDIPRTECNYTGAEKVTDVKGSCTVAEQYHYNCTVCGKAGKPQYGEVKGHEMGEESVPANCVGQGWTKTFCKNCDEVTNTVYTEDKDPNYHTTGEKGAGLFSVVVEATCTTAGLKTIYCPACNMKPIDEEIPALGHTITAIDVVEAHCGTPASHKDYCAKCGYTSDIIIDGDANGHGYDKGWEVIDIQEATCLTNKIETRRCKDCYTDDGNDENDEIVTEEIENTKLGHDWAQPNVEADAAYVEVKYPTCQDTRGGYYTKCKRCDVEPLFRDYSEIDNEFVYDSANPKHHINSKIDTSVGADGIFRRPTCDPVDGEGYYQYTCDNPECETGGTFRVVSDADWGKCEYFKDTVNNYVPYKAATCTENGNTEGYTCLSCKTVYASETIKATGHTEETVKGYAATCTTTGMTDGTKCSVCDAVLVAQEEIEALGHDEETVAGTPATCLSAGLSDGKYCKRCETTTVEQTVIEKLEHKFDEASDKMLVLPTCTTKGYTIYFCSTCTEDEIAETEFNIGDRQYIRDYVPANGHTEVIDEAVKATCNTKSLSEGKHCSVCDTVLVAQVEGDYLKDEKGNLIHYNGEEVIDPYCKKGEGTVEDITCTVCNKVVERVHSNLSVSNINATCTTEGYETEICSNCGYSNLIAVRPATGHNYEGGYTVVTPATIGAAGSYKYVCQNGCGIDDVSDEYVIPALGGIEFLYEIANENGGSVIANSNTIKVTVKTNATAALISSITLKLGYNTEVLEYVGYDFVNSTNIEGGKFGEYLVGGADGKVSIFANANANDNANVTLNGVETLVVLTFNVLNDAYGKTIEILPNKTDSLILTYDEETSESVEIKLDSYGAGVKADVVKLGKLAAGSAEELNASDVIELVKISKTFNENDPSTYDAQADINKDGVVDLVDAYYIKLLIAELITYDDLCKAQPEA